MELINSDQKIVAAFHPAGMSQVGHSRPMHLVPVPINVRCYSNSNPIVRRSEVTLRGHKETWLSAGSERPTHSKFEKRAEDRQTECQAIFPRMITSQWLRVFWLR